MRVNEVGGCFGCPQTRSNGLFITPDGEGTSGILFVGDSPGKDAAFQGRNFSGADGAHYDKWLKWINLTRLQVYTANSMWCPPPQDGWIDAKRLTPDAFASLNNCRGHLDDFIALHRDKIKVIVPMGPVALGRVCSVERIEKNQGYVHETGWGIPAVPTFHPRYVMMGKTKLTPAVMNALRRAQSIANGTYKASEFKLILDPPVDELRSYLGKFPRDIPEITTDIETPDSSTLDEDDLDLDAEGDDEEGEVEEAVLPGEHRDASYNIIRASFSLEPNVAVTFPFEAPYIDVYFDLLRRSQIMWEWTNQHFDSFRLRAAGATFNKVGSAMWCLDGDTNLLGVDGSRYNLRDVVNNKRPVTLLSADEDGKPISVKVVDWQRKSVKNQEWLSIKLGERRLIRCTPDHRIWTPEGWQEAGKLKVGDFVQTPHRGNASLIHGTILGDGYVTKSGDLHLLHSVKQTEWLTRKANNLDANVCTRPPSGFGVNADCTASKHIGKFWRHMFYTPTKTFVEPTDMATVAVWYCDDGTWNNFPVAKENPSRKSWATRTWKANHGKALFCVEGFSELDQRRILAWATKTFGDSVAIYNLGKCAATLALKRESRDAFFNAIAPYMPPEMQYKLPEPYRNLYNGWLEVPTFQWEPIDTISSVIKPASVRYCVTVDHPTHRFFTNVGLVSNCHHFWQSDLPKALAFAAPFWYRGPAWKQTSSSSPSYYSAMDSAVQDACLQGTRDALKAEGRWDAFMKHGVEADAIMVRMCEPGFKIDRTMQAEFKEVVIKECARAIGDLQTKVPEDVRGIHPKKGYSKVPKEGAAIPGAVVDKDTEPAIRDILLANSKLVQRVIGGEEKWAWLKPFNINSSQQVAELIKSLGLPVPFDRKKNKNTTEAKHLKKLAKRNAIFHDLLNARQYGKMASTYFWPLDGDDLCYSHFGFNPSTWRKNSYQINSQNIPKRSDLAQRFRQMIIARPGHVFVAFDSSAIEAVLVGFYAGSQRYIQLAKAGVHDWVTSCKLGKPIPLDLLFSDFAEFKARCKEMKKENPELREKMKRVVHLSGYMGTPGRMLEEYPDDFRDLKEATDLQNLFFNTEAGQDVKGWQNRTLTLAHKEHVLRTPFHYWHYFYSVFAWDSQYKQWRLGTDAKRAVAFKPQASASAIQTEILLWIAAEHPEMLPWLRLIIHDEIILEVPEAFQADAIAAMEVGMTQGWPALDGLGIGAEGKWGKNLGEWSKDNSDGMRGC